MSERVNRKRALDESYLANSTTIPFHGNAIFNLPRPIFHIIFGEYLKLDNIARFDNVVLNDQDRTLFLGHLSNMAMRSTFHVRGKYILRWLFQRRVLLSSMTFDLHNKPIENIMFEVFPMNVSALEELTISNLPESGEHLALVESLKKLCLRNKAVILTPLLDTQTFWCKLGSVSVDGFSNEISLNLLHFVLISNPLL